MGRTGPLAARPSRSLERHGPCQRVAFRGRGTTRDRGAQDRSTAHSGLSRFVCDILAEHVASYPGEYMFTHEGNALRRHNFYKRVWKPVLRERDSSQEPGFMIFATRRPSIAIVMGERPPGTTDTRTLERDGDFWTRTHTSSRLSRNN